MKVSPHKNLFKEKEKALESGSFTQKGHFDSVQVTFVLKQFFTSSR